MGCVVALRLALVLMLAASAGLAGCQGGTVGQASGGAQSPSSTVPASTTTIPPRPAVPDGPLPNGVGARLDLVTDSSALVSPEGPTGERVRVATVIGQLGDSGDVRIAWVLVDLMMFEARSELTGPLIDAVQKLMGVTLDDEVAWVGEANLLLSWDIPAPPGYLRWKRRIFIGRDPSWSPFFPEESPTPTSNVDWRQVSFSGVFRDGVSALDHPRSVKASDGRAWPDDTVVVGVEVGGARRAYPRPLLEKYELANDSLGGREIAMPYCSLCATAVPYFTDQVAGTDGARSGEALFLRTSGLLLRSNKLMYDQRTESLIDQFTGRALTGPLGTSGVKLQAVDVVTTTWGQWRRAHADTTIVVPAGEDVAALVAKPSLADTRDRFGPVFPTGPVDARLPAQSLVLGTVGPDGVAVAFLIDAAAAALARGRAVTASGVEVSRGADGALRTRAVGGPPILSRQAYWFAWSEFMPGTRLWTGP